MKFVRYGNDTDTPWPDGLITFDLLNFMIMDWIKICSGVYKVIIEIFADIIMSTDVTCIILD